MQRTHLSSIKTTAEDQNKGNRAYKHASAQAGTDICVDTSRPLLGLSEKNKGNRAYKHASAQADMDIYVDTSLPLLGLPPMQT
jgi:hypothetical protein